MKIELIYNRIATAGGIKMKKYKCLMIVLVIVFSLLIVGIFSAFGYLLYQKNEDRFQNEMKENLEIVVDDNEQETSNILSDNDEDVENMSQNEGPDSHQYVTSKPQKTEKPENNKQQQDSKQRSKEEIQEQFLIQFLGEQYAYKATESEGKLVLYNQYYPGICAEFTYDEAETFLNSSESERQKIKQKAENMSKVNHLWLSYSLYLEYYNIVKKALPQDTEFQFYFEVLNPWTSADVEYNETEFWGVLTSEKPLYVNVMILFEQSQGYENYSEVSDAVYQKVKENFTGNAVKLEVSTASVNHVKEIEAYQIKQYFLYDSKSLDNISTDIWNLGDKSEAVNLPGSGASNETEYYYDSEMKQIRENVLSVYADLDLDLDAADVDGKVFMLYSKSKPGINVELTYSASDDLKSPEIYALNHLLIKEEIYDELVSCVNEHADGADFKLDSHFNLPGGNLVYSEDKEAFLEAFTHVPFYYFVYVVLDENAENADLNQLNESLSRLVSEFYGDISMKITVNSVISTQYNQIEAYMLQKLFAYEKNRLGGEVIRYTLEK